MFEGRSRMWFLNLIDFYRDAQHKVVPEGEITKARKALEDLSDFLERIS
jgi:hypothetical protein